MITFASGFNFSRIAYPVAASFFLGAAMAYSATTWVSTSTLQASLGSPVSAAKWNSVLANLDDLDQRMSSISSSSSSGYCVVADFWSSSVGPYLAFPVWGTAYRWQSFGTYTWNAYTTSPTALSDKQPPNSNFYWTDAVVCTNSTYPNKMVRTTLTCSASSGYPKVILGAATNFCFGTSPYSFQ